MIPKPPISLDLSDSFSQTAGNSSYTSTSNQIIENLFGILAEHFNQFLCRYGSPVVVLNMVKKQEKKRNESLLTEKYLIDVSYLK